MKPNEPVFSNNIILSSKAIALADSLSVKLLGIKALCLMESAGRRFVDLLAQEYNINNKIFVIFCGKGNNGGDGMVIARELHERKINFINLFLFAPENSLSKENKINFKILKKFASKKIYINKLENIQENNLLENNLENILEKIKPDFLIDSLLGSGTRNNSSLSSPLREAINSINKYKNKYKNSQVISVDLPSGINPDTGEIPDLAVKADMTISMACLKTGCFLSPANSHCGKLKIADIGIPEFIIKRALKEQAENSGFLITRDFVKEKLREIKRTPELNKYKAGSLGIIGGSSGMSGAITMACMAGIKTGSSYISCFCPKDIQKIVAVNLPEALVFDLLEKNSKNKNNILERLNKLNALLIGTGLGQETITRDYFIEILKIFTENNKPVLIDADGLNLLAKNPELLTNKNIFGKNRKFILTPHEGEFLGLINSYENLNINKINTESLQQNKINLLRKYSKIFNSVILLKGFPSIICTPDNNIFINSTGNPACICAGSGDVLSGIIASLLAQKLDTESSAICGIHIAGACADLYAQEYNNYSNSLSPLEIINKIKSSLDFLCQ